MSVEVLLEHCLLPVSQIKGLQLLTVMGIRVLVFLEEVMDLFKVVI